MERKRCFICSQQCFPKRNIKNQPHIGTIDEGEVDNQVQIVFLLRKLLEIPEDTCCKLLKHFGNPSQWIECCNSCTVLVDKCQSILHQIASLEKQYDELQMTIRNTILTSQKYVDYDLQCEAIVRSQIISKDIDYFIKTTTFDNSEESSSFPSPRKTVDINASPIYPYEEEEIQSYRGCDEHLPSNDLDPLTGGADKIDSDIQRTVAVLDFDKNEELQDYEESLANENNFFHQEMADSEIDVKLHLPQQCEANAMELPLVETHNENETTTKRSVTEIPKKQTKKRHCQVCGKLMAGNHLKIHMRTHTKAKPFKCEICGQLFRQTSHLKGHITRHSGVKQYKCDMCGQRFRRSDVLKTHFGKYHTTDQEYPFQCFMCGQSSSDLESLKMHYRQHTEEKDECFKCLICGKSHKTLKELKLHNTTHSEEQIQQ